MQIDKELLKGSTTMLVLTVLQRRQMYGYEIIKELQAQSSGLLALAEGTLYPILHTMESQGYLSADWQRSPQSRRRKYYSLTDTGRTLLASRRQEWDAFQRAVSEVLHHNERAEVTS